MDSRLGFTDSQTQYQNWKKMVSDSSRSKNKSYWAYGQEPIQFNNKQRKD